MASQGTRERVNTCVRERLPGIPGTSTLLGCGLPTGHRLPPGPATPQAPATSPTSLLRSPPPCQPAASCLLPSPGPWLCLLGLWSMFGTPPARLAQSPAWALTRPSEHSGMSHTTSNLGPKVKAPLFVAVLSYGQRADAPQCPLENENAKCGLFLQWTVTFLKKGDPNACHGTGGPCGQDAE